MGQPFIRPPVEYATEANAPRFLGLSRGHVESYFLRANHPEARLAVWLKATVLIPEDGGDAVAEAWCAVFDGESGVRCAEKATVPLDAARFEGSPLCVRLSGCEFLFDGCGRSSGRIDGPSGPLAWDLSWSPIESAMKSPLALFPLRRLIDGGFPRSKPLTPYPLLTFEGELSVGDRTIAVESWLGMQGHNWGQEHSHEYAWGQCTFTDSDRTPVCVAEAFSARTKIRGWVTPVISALVVRRDREVYLFNRLYDLWRQKSEQRDLSWTLRLFGPDGEAQLYMRAQPNEVVCLGYKNPNGVLSYCMNSKLAFANLRVNPPNKDGFECTSDHGGALEILTKTRDPRIVRVV